MAGHAHTRTPLDSARANVRVHADDHWLPIHRHIGRLVAVRGRHDQCLVAGRRRGFLRVQHKSEGLARRLQATGGSVQRIATSRAD